MIHFLLYSDMFDLEGIVVGKPKGNMAELRKVWSAYKKDYKYLSFHSADYLPPRKLRRLFKWGARREDRTPPQGWSKSTAGSRMIVRAALKDDPRPLHIISWGSVTDVAQAIHNRPEIKKRIKLFAIANYHRYGYNTQGDRYAYEYLLKQRGLHWISGSSTVRGIYLTGMGSKKKYGNVGFVSKVVRKYGAMGKLFYRISEPINVNRYGLKMGDTASLLFLMNGDFDNPRKPSWGGTYCKYGKTFWADCKKATKLGPYPGAWTVAIHRRNILKHWEKRMKRLSRGIKRYIP
jgi:hypothetical protein